MAPKPHPAASASSGIRSLGNGESVIPSSTRADGTVRKEIRVKPGYKPPEDVEVYKNRTAEAWKNRGKGGVPGAEAAGSDGSEPPHKAAANKNAKRREARKRAAATGAGDDAEVQSNGDAGERIDAMEPTNGIKEAQSEPNGAIVDGSAKTTDPEADAAKEARKLTKKLRQARELREKERNGDTLLPEQVEKVIKIDELVKQLESLGFNADGEHVNGTVEKG